MSVRLPTGLANTPFIDRATLQVTVPWLRFLGTLVGDINLFGAGSSATPATTPPPDVAVAGLLGAVSTRYAREDHTHGAIENTTPPPGLAVTSALGVSTKLARADHAHGGLATSAPPAIGLVSSVGDTAVAWGNHTHAASVYGGVLTLTNDDTVVLPIGTPVYIDAADGCKQARGDQASTANVAGLVVLSSINVGATGPILRQGLLTATTAQWDVITRQAGGLTLKATYYLDPFQSGKLTPTVPFIGGSYVVAVGQALSTTELLVHLTRSILL